MGGVLSMGFDSEKEPKQPFWVHCGVCGSEWIAAYTPIPLDVIARKLKKAKCPNACAERKIFCWKNPKATPTGDYMAWLDNGDTGISSETIWSVMTGLPVPRADRFSYGYPSDPDDFGRCYRLLQIMPEWLGRMGEVAAKHPDGWSKLVPVWAELTALYEEEVGPTHQGSAPKLYRRMKELLD